MGSTFPETTSEQQTLSELVDREAIADLIHRFGVVLDEQRFDDLPSVFPEDATITTPGDHAQGLDAIVAHATRNHTPELEVRSLAGTLRRWRDQILAWHQAKVTNGPTEAFNNLIKRIDGPQGHAS